MNSDLEIAGHHEMARRWFLRLGVSLPVMTSVVNSRASLAALLSEQPPGKTAKAGAQPDPYFTPVAEFQDVSRGKPIPHSLSEDQRRAAGLTRETWQLEVVADPEHPPRLRSPLSKADGTALTFDRLMELAKEKSVRFAKVMTCLNLGCPLGMGLWEGVPLRDVIWLTEPRENLRRVFYYGFHNDDPAQMFRSSLPIGRVLEDAFGLPPVILCYKLNGEWLDAERGGPVRIVVPEAYGFKSVKWLSHVVLTNLPHANDTYAEQNNDVDSPLKTFAATLMVPQVVRANEEIRVSGYAQVGVAGLSRVQVSLEPEGVERSSNDQTFDSAPWIDAELLPAPEAWISLPDSRIPSATHGFNEDGRPVTWPMPLTNAHWVATLPGVPVGRYILRSRTIDGQGNAQPMPRPYRKSGHAAIESVPIEVGE